MDRHGVPRALGPPDLQHNDRLGLRSRTTEGGNKAVGLSDGLDKPPDDPGIGVVDQIFEVIGGHQYGFVSGRNEMAEAKTPDVAEQADEEGADLRDNADISGKPGRVAQLLQIARAAMMGAEHTHAVRPAQRNAGFPTEPLDPGLQP